jgi:hypothetical protein
MSVSMTMQCKQELESDQTVQDFFLKKIKSLMPDGGLVA